MIKTTNTVESTFRIIPAVATGVIAATAANYFNYDQNNYSSSGMSPSMILGVVVGGSTFVAENISKWVLPKIGLGNLSSMQTQMIAVPAVAGLALAGAIAVMNPNERDPTTLLKTAALGGASYVAGKYVGDWAASMEFAY